MDYLKSVLASKTIIDASGKSHRLHSGMGADEATMIIELCKKANAKKTLEVGMAYGISSMAFSIAHRMLGNTRGYCHVAIDPNQKTQWNGLGLWNVQQVGYDKHVKLVETTSDLALPGLLKDDASFDVILIDGWHTFDATLLDIYYCSRLLRVGGYLIVDDTWMKSIRQVLDYVKKNYRHLKLVHKGTSAVFLKTGQDSRDWNFHVMF